MSMQVGGGEGLCTICAEHKDSLEISVSRFHDVESIALCFDCIRGLVEDFKNRKGAT